MKIEIGLYEAKTNADLVSSFDVKVKDKIRAVETLKAFMLINPIRGVNIKKLIEEGRT